MVLKRLKQLMKKRTFFLSEVNLDYLFQAIERKDQPKTFDEGLMHYKPI